MDPDFSVSLFRKVVDLQIIRVGENCKLLPTCNFYNFSFPNRVSGYGYSTLRTVGYLDL